LRLRLRTGAGGMVRGGLASGLLASEAGLAVLRAALQVVVLLIMTFPAMSPAMRC